MLGGHQPGRAKDRAYPRLGTTWSDGAIALAEVAAFLAGAILTFLDPHWHGVVVMAASCSCWLMHLRVRGVRERRLLATRIAAAQIAASPGADPALIARYVVEDARREAFDRKAAEKRAKVHAAQDAAASVRGMK